MAIQRKKRPQDTAQSPIAAEPKGLFASPELDTAEIESSPEVLSNDGATPELRREQASRTGFDFGSTSLFANSSGASSDRSPSAKLPIQARLTVGAVGDKYEQEADSVAAQVVDTINDPAANQPVQRDANSQSADDEAVQRMDGEEEELQIKPDLQRMGGEEEEELQTKPDLQKVGREGGAVSEGIEAEIQNTKGSGQPLDTGLQKKMGQAMGADFSGVKIHTDARSHQLNRAVQAKAFTTGTDIFFSQGQYKPNDKGGQELLAHELTHVVQQNGATVRRKPEKNPQISEANAPTNHVQREHYLWADQGLNVSFNVEEKFAGLVTTGAGPCVAVALDATYGNQRALSLAHFDENTITATTLPKMYESLIKALKIGDINSIPNSGITIVYHLGGGVGGYLKELEPVVEDYLQKKTNGKVSVVRGSIYDSQDAKKQSEAFKIDKSGEFKSEAKSFDLEEETFAIHADTSVSKFTQLELLTKVYKSAELYDALLASLKKSEFLDVKQDDSKDYGKEHYKDMLENLSISQKMKEDPKVALEKLQEFVKEIEEDQKRCKAKIAKNKHKKDDDKGVQKSKKIARDNANKKLQELNEQLKDVQETIQLAKGKLEQQEA